MRELHDFDQSAVEIAFRERKTGIEAVVEDLRSAREQSNRALLEASKGALCKHLLAQSANASIDRRNQGKRYAVFSIDDCYVKVLVSEGRYSPFGLDRNGLERVLSRHALEHSAVCHYFGDAVPDTLFFGSTIEFEGDNQFSKAMSTNPFLAQEGVKEPKTIVEASKGPIAERFQFRESLIRVLESFTAMGEEVGLVPDIPNLEQQNVLVDPTGQIWIVDTNTLVIPEEYHRFGFQFVPEMEKLIADVEKGHIKGNPQG